MELKEQVYSLLLVSAADNFNRSISDLLPENIYYPVKTVTDMGSAKRELLNRSYDIVIINKGRIIADGALEQIIAGHASLEDAFFALTGSRPGQSW